jgi:hypothetical protein
MTLHLPSAPFSACPPCPPASVAYSIIILYAAPTRALIAAREPRQMTSLTNSYVGRHKYDYKQPYLKLSSTTMII